MWIDVEGPGVLTAPPTTPAAAVATARANLDTARMFREFHNLNWELELYTYSGHLWMTYADLMDRDAMRARGASAGDLAAAEEFASIEREHARQYSGFTGSPYNGSVSIATGGESFFASIDRLDVYCRRYYPDLYDNRVAFVCPRYVASAGDVKAGDPVPIGLYKRQVDYAVADGWHIFDWDPYWDLPPVKQHVDYLLRFA
jgi:hypothetical protein